MSRWFPLMLAFLITAGVTLADDPHVVEKHEVKVVLSDGGDAETFSLDSDQLEVGESRQFFTQEGKEILIARGDDGLEITVDGESLADFTDIGEKAFVFKTTTSGAQIHHLRLGEGESGHQVVWVGAEDGDAEGHVWVGADEVHSHAFVAGDRPHGAFAHLQRSGALEGLDEEAVDRIEEALRAYERSSVKVIKLIEKEHAEQH